MIKDSEKEGNYIIIYENISIPQIDDKNTEVVITPYGILGYITYDEKNNQYIGRLNELSQKIMCPNFGYVIGNSYESCSKQLTEQHVYLYQHVGKEIPPLN